MTTATDLSASAERGLEAAETASSRPPRQDRRASHDFQMARGQSGQLDVSDGCLVCGYAEAGHPGLNDHEQQVIADLLNQLQGSPFIRRSILRKLDLN